MRLMVAGCPFPPTAELFRPSPYGLRAVWDRKKLMRKESAKPTSKIFSLRFSGEKSNNSFLVYRKSKISLGHVRVFREHLPVDVVSTRCQRREIHFEHTGVCTTHSA